jgi:2-C-methyl-D-erythritol 4-phosphate cytidylyltransferase
MTVWAIVVAAGSGSRFGGAKQYERLGDRRVLDWSLAAARTVSDGVVLVVPPDRAGHEEPGADAVVPGGATRSASVRAGLAAVPAEATVVLVHDAARPLASHRLWQAVADAVDAGAAAAVPAVPVTDTIRRRDGGTVDRAGLLAVQTPQGFRPDVLRRAHEGGPEGTDDASLAEAAGAAVRVLDGEPQNIKVTTAVDLAMLEVLCR